MVVDRMTECLYESNANLNGYFVTSERVHALLSDSRRQVDLRKSQGGAVRVGPVHCNSKGELEQLLESLAAIL